MLKEILESMNEGDKIVVQQSDWDDLDGLGGFMVMNPETGEKDIIIGWSDEEDPDTFGAMLDDDNEDMDGDFKAVSSWLKKRGIIFNKKLYDFAVKRMTKMNGWGKKSKNTSKPQDSKDYKDDPKYQELSSRDKKRVDTMLIGGLDFGMALRTLKY